MTTRRIAGLRPWPGCSSGSWRFAAVAVSLTSARRLHFLDVGFGPLPAAGDSLYRVPVVGTEGPPAIFRQAACSR